MSPTHPTIAMPQGAISRIASGRIVSGRIVSRRCTRDSAEVGMASLWVLILATVLLVAGSAAIAIAQVSLVRQRVAAAADLAALAAATDLWRGDMDHACREAAAVATANHGDLASCEIAYPNATVEVESSLPTLVNRLAGLAGQSAPKVRVRARAGPPTAP